MTFPAPPIADREPRTTSIHNTTLVDDYAWLRDKGTPRVQAYLEAENAYTAAAMAGTEALQQQLYDEVLSHIKEDDVSVPTATARGSTSRAPRRASSTPATSAAPTPTHPKNSCST